MDLGYHKHLWHLNVNFYLDLVLDFLQENNCYSQFMDNFKRYNHQPFLEFMHFRVKSMNAFYLFCYAFHWKYTPEGDEYWENIQKKFEIKFNHTFPQP